MAKKPIKTRAKALTVSTLPPASPPNPVAKALPKDRCA